MQGWPSWASDALADLLGGSPMKLYELTKRPYFPALDRWFAPVNAPLSFERPFLRILATKKCTVDILPLPSNLAAP